MKKCRSSIYLATSMLVFAIGAPCFAQDGAAAKSEDKPAPGDDAQMMATMLELAKPGENHKILEATTGTWTYKVKWWMRPDAPPMESTGTTTTKSVMDGRYFISEHSGKMSMPGPDGKVMDAGFQGMATEGYDNAKKKFVASWIDNMGTGIMSMEGTYDPGTKTLTYVGEEEPMPGMKFAVRQSVTYSDKDHHKMEFYEVHGGKEIKMMEIEYARSQS
jgi:Protein of unknown function (DUF1579)